MPQIFINHLHLSSIVQIAKDIIVCKIDTITELIKSISFPEFFFFFSFSGFLGRIELELKLESLSHMQTHTHTFTYMYTYMYVYAFLNMYIVHNKLNGFFE